MDIIKILQTLEEALYEVTTWLVLLPKTYFKVVIRPDWIQRYITIEWMKELPERFKNYLSPLLFWIFVVVLPYIFIFKIPLSKTAFLRPLLASFPQDTNIIFTAIILLIMPAVFSVMLLKVSGKPIDKETLKHVFYMQCYCCAPFQAATIPSYIVSYLVDLKPDLPQGIVTFSSLLFYVGIVWFIIAQTFIFKQELNKHWQKALGIVILTFCIEFLIEFLVVVVLLFVSLIMMVSTK
jgi:hypothetical protein